MSTKISILDKIVSRVKWLAKKYPNAEYILDDTTGNCLYTKGHVDNGPKSLGCLIGQAILHVCPELKKKLQHMDDKVVGASVCLVNLGICDTTYITDLKLLDDIQYWQDSGEKWSEAVRLATE